jgi:ATPase subunit of ABC transporter with duplicated ATPase domains
MSKAVGDIGVITEESSERILDGLNEGVSRIDEFCNYWIDKKKPVEQEVRKIKMQLGEQKLHPERLEELAKERARIEPILKELQRYETKLRRLYDERKELKDEIQQKRHEIFKVRDQEKDRINDKLKEKLRVNVLFEEEKRRFTEYLKDMLKGSGVGNAVDSLVSPIGKTIDGILLSDYINQGSGKLIEGFNLTKAKADQIVKWFEDEKKLFELETLFPEDKIEISLKVNGEYKKIDGLSAGQKATALLLLLFAREENPLIIDQPEEDLDNRFIYEDVVKTLRDMKGKRQLIIATHNANIPVLGDSELIIVLESEAGRCKIIDRGSIDKESIRQGVKNIMEGGEEAFMRRAGKYGYGGL